MHTKRLKTTSICIQCITCIKFFSERLKISSVLESAKESMAETEFFKSYFVVVITYHDVLSLNFCLLLRQFFAFQLEAEIKNIIFTCMMTQNIV